MKQKQIFQYLSRYGILVAFLILILLLSLLSPAFLKTTNIMNILRQTSVNGIVAVGMTFVIILAGIDLSVGSVIALAAVIAASFAHSGDYPLIVPVFAGLAVGGLCGFLNGFVIAKRKIAPFIMTLAMMTIARGAALVYTNGRPVIELSDSYNKIGGSYFLGIPLPVIIFIIIIFIGWVLLSKTVFGRHVYATGGNTTAAALSGIKTGKITIWVYTLAGILSGLAGIVLSSRVMSGSPATGQGYELDAIAAVVIGGTRLTGGVGTIFGTIVGVLIIGVMNNGLDLLNVSSYWQLVVKGIIILLAVVLEKKNSR
ncbi:MAG: ABC transporter permease [Porphyromonadaceae bacterium]|nr:MAG: ABC transporter permease [Porphyromonadaceae bacterium]